MTQTQVCLSIRVHFWYGFGSGVQVPGSFETTLLSDRGSWTTEKGRRENRRIFFKDHPDQAWPMSANQLSSRKVQGPCFLFPALTRLGWLLWPERGRGETEEKPEICQGTRKEPQEMLYLKICRLLKGKQSLEGVRSPRGEEGKTVRDSRGQWNNRDPLPTHFLCH